jgi:hypothetical protein
MTGDQTGEPDPPRTLFEAHEALGLIRPRQAAPPAEWLAYYQKSAALYAEVAEIDRGRHHEALAEAEHARHQAKDIKARISARHATAGEE